MTTRARFGVGSRRQGASRKLALLAGTMLALGFPSATLAQSASSARTVQQTIAIPAGPLTTALNCLAVQTGIEILFDASLTNGRLTNGVSGTLTAAEALDALLAGTGINARFAGGNQVVLSGPQTGTIASDDLSYGGAISLDAITVYGARDARTLQDVSASVGVVQAEQIEDGEIRYLRDSFRLLGNVMSSATLNAGFVIRGMSSEGFVPAGAPPARSMSMASLQTRYNARFGARSLSGRRAGRSLSRPTIDVSGRAAMIGAIYLKTKDPTYDKTVEISGTAGNNELYGSAFIVNTPLIDNQVALRVSGSFEQAKNTVTFPTYVDYAGYDDTTSRGKPEPARQASVHALGDA